MFQRVRRLLDIRPGEGLLSKGERMSRVREGALRHPRIGGSASYRLKEQPRVPVIIDADVRIASEAAVAIALVADAVLMNTAMKHAVIAGRDRDVA